ncbi:MAG: hypothetical protein Q7K42_03975 [Candidatus Diapherotrites archaeon]|nr:hypothetical protein [Candidatus Diapherotrites archaeon]
MPGPKPRPRPGKPPKKRRQADHIQQGRRHFEDKHLGKKLKPNERRRINKKDWEEEEE